MNEDNQVVVRWRDVSGLSPSNKTARERASSAVADYEHSHGGRFGVAELDSGRIFPGRSRQLNIPRAAARALLLVLRAV